MQLYAHMLSAQIQSGMLHAIARLVDSDQQYPAS